MSNIDKQLYKLKKLQSKHHAERKESSSVSALDRAKNITRADIQNREAYCANLMKHKTTFSFLTNLQIQQIAQSTEIVEYQKGDILLSQNESSEKCFIIASGTASVTDKKADGFVAKLAPIGKDQIVGEMALFAAVMWKLADILSLYLVTMQRYML